MNETTRREGRRLPEKARVTPRPRALRPSVRTDVIVKEAIEVIEGCGKDELGEMTGIREEERGVTR